jgi:hypothetical protein
MVSSNPATKLSVEEEMSAQMRGFAVALTCILALAECTASDVNPHGDAPSASSIEVPTARAAQKQVPAPKTEDSGATWRHLPEPVGVERYNQDKANCTKVGNDAPGAGSPELKFYLTFTKCMRSAGYEPNDNSQ